MILRVKTTALEARSVLAPYPCSGLTRLVCVSFSFEPGQILQLLERSLDAKLVILLSKML